MRPRPRPLRTPALVLAACLAVAACGGGEEPAAAPTEITAAPTTTTTSSPVPDEITVEYVQQVIDTLDDSFGDMIRRYRDDGGPTPETDAWPALLYSDEALANVRTGISAMEEVEFANVRDEPEGPATAVQEVVTAAPDCVHAVVTRSYEPLILRVVNEERTKGYLSLERDDVPRSDPEGRALPPWRILFEGRSATGSEVPNPCA